MRCERTQANDPIHAYIPCIATKTIKSPFYSFSASLCYMYLRLLILMLHSTHNIESREHRLFVYSLSSSYFYCPTGHHISYVCVRTPHSPTLVATIGHNICHRNADFISNALLFCLIFRFPLFDGLSPTAPTPVLLFYRHENTIESSILSIRVSKEHNFNNPDKSFRNFIASKK